MNGSYSVVLTHDIDAMSLREIPICSRTFWGFPYRGIIVNTQRFVRRDLSFAEYGRSLSVSIMSPAVKAGLVRDPLLSSFERMIKMEREYGVRSTMFLIPLSRYRGHVIDCSEARPQRQSYYQLPYWADRFRSLERDGWELAVHGLDAHISTDCARAELESFSRHFHDCPGLRMHWLYSSDNLRTNAKQAGYSYDSTLGWNDKIGFPDGHFGPFIDGNSGLPVLPINVQDGALLGEWRQGLSRARAWLEIERLMNQAAEKRAVVTILWHSHSFGPPRYWERVYRYIIEKALRDGARVIRAIDAVKEFCQHCER